jgi:hypothetical protein
MIEIISGPLVSSPVVWNLVFEHKPVGWWSHLALGRYKHVRAYGYVPFLHIWQFVDVGLSGFEVFVAADGPAANAVISVWIASADVIAMRKVSRGTLRMPVFGFCVPAMKRLIGLHTRSLRPDSFYRDCLRAGGVAFEQEVPHAAQNQSAAALGISP